MIKLLKIIAGSMAIIAGLGFLSSVLDKKKKDEGILKVDLSIKIFPLHKASWPLH